jgi:hypothetical protein
LLLLLVVWIKWRNVKLLVAKTGSMESLQHTARRLPVQGGPAPFVHKVICRDEYDIIELPNMKGGVGGGKD